METTGLRRNSELAQSIPSSVTFTGKPAFYTIMNTNMRNIFKQEDFPFLTVNHETSNYFLFVSRIFMDTSRPFPNIILSYNVDF